MSLETGPAADALTDAAAAGAGQDAPGRSTDMPARPPRRRPSRRRFWVRRGVVLGVLLLLVAGIWLGASAVLARKALLRAQTATVALRADLETGELDRVGPRLAAIQRDARSARRLTSTPVWSLAGGVPVAGDTVRTVRGLAAEADVLAARVLPRFVAIASATSGGGLRDGDRIDIHRLRTMHADLSVAGPELDGIVRRVQQLPDGLLLTPVAAARTSLLTETASIARTTSRLRDATSIAPAMLGADGVRRYFVALQTNAELRGSGGLVGAYAIVEADQGRVRLAELGPNTALRNTYPLPTEGLEPAFAERYGQFGSDGFWLNSNMSAHFPTVSRLWTSMYERTTGTRIDGVIATDPVALAEILKATGPATAPGGERVGADNIVALSGQTIYERYPALAQDELRNRVQLEIARSLYDRLIAPVSHDVGLFPQLGAAAAGGHVRMASNHADEQLVLERTSVGGALPATAGAYLQVAVNNAGGTKLDYYLAPSISYAFEDARADRQNVTATIRLRNGAPATGLPEYVVIRPDQPGNAAAIPGQNRLHMSVYAGRGATLRGASVDGVAVNLDAGAEHGHPVWSTFLTLDPGQERTLVVALTEPGTEQLVTVVPPPTVTPAVVGVRGGRLR